MSTLIKIQSDGSLINISYLYGSKPRENYLGIVLYPRQVIATCIWKLEFKEIPVDSEMGILLAGAGRFLPKMERL